MYGTWVPADMKYLQRRSKERLYKQWVEQAELPNDQVPPDVLGEQSAEDLSGGGVSGYTPSIDVDRGMVRLPIRYVFLGLAVIASLLVALSVVVTILIMRP